jgi:D-arabinono-1,4-lactone oxidase
MRRNRLPRIIPKDDDGFYHPASEDELVALVQAAYREGRQLRVRGATHSISHAIYTDPLAGIEDRVSHQEPPDGDNINVMLDLYRGWRVKDEARKLVEADAGIHLGEDPSDPKRTATLETSLLWQLDREKGWTLSDPGGVTHQTVSGFTATGSSGGSLQYSVNDNLWGFRVIDGRGDVHELSREDPDPDPFYAMSPNIGLLGVVSTITFECVDMFNISGQEAITSIDDCAVDMFGDGSRGKPSMAQFLQDAEYSRVEWWPQRGAERVLVWQAQRIRPQLGFRPSRYEEFTANSEVTEVFISILYTVLGNIRDLSAAREKLQPALARLDEALDALDIVKSMGRIGEILADFLSHAAKHGIDGALALLKPFAGRIERDIPEIFPKILATFISLDSEKDGMQKGEPQCFRDLGWQGLPMDNQADDQLLPTEFTELWIPLGRTQQVMQLLHQRFTEPEDPQEAYRRTGLYGWELYSAMPNRFWLNASHSSGDDEWKDGAFRVDPYWFALNPGNPAETFFPPLWQLLRDAGVPFRLHWGKFQPAYARDDRDWIDFFRSQYPRWDDFLRLREERDPNNIFLTSYWRDRFGLWDAPEPRPVDAP